MDMPDFRFHYAVTLADERIRNLRRERRMQIYQGRDRRLPEPRPKSRGRWSVADFVSLLVPNRDAR